MSLEMLKGQMAVEQAYITYFQVRIQSGVYKTRIRHKTSEASMINGVWTFTGPLCSEQELLEDEINTMHRHIKRMNDLVDAISLAVEEEEARQARYRFSLSRGHTNSMGPG